MWQSPGWRVPSLPAPWPFLVTIVSAVMVQVLPSGRTVPVLLALSHASEVRYQSIYSIYIYIFMYIYIFINFCLPGSFSCKSFGIAAGEKLAKHAPRAGGQTLPSLRPRDPHLFLLLTPSPSSSSEGSGEPRSPVPRPPGPSGSFPSPGEGVSLQKSVTQEGIERKPRGSTV